jgi:hypothetical protein
MRKKTIVAVVGASLMLALAVALAQAGERRARRMRAAQSEAVVVVPAPLCEKLCPQDLSPCDPLYFKIADARCAQIGAGR